MTHFIVRFTSSSSAWLRPISCGVALAGWLVGAAAIPAAAQVARQAPAQVAYAPDGQVPVPVAAPVAAPQSAPAAPSVTPAVEFRQPAYPGGPAELARFLNQNLHFPAEAAEAHVSGRVVVSFWVDEAGRPYGFGAVQSPHPALEAEALRVARKIAHWEPGVQDGHPAPMQMYLPVVFKLMVQ